MIEFSVCSGEIGPLSVSTDLGGLRQIVESPIDEYISAETNHPNYNISTFFSSDFVLIGTYLAE